MPPFGLPDTFEAEPLPQPSGWGISVSKPEIENELEKKKLFGIELAKDHANAFEAAIATFGDNTGLALWVSSNWLSDPEVIASRDLYANTVGVKSKLLDKNQTSVELLKIAQDKVHGRYTAEARDRLKALELYAKLQGFLNDALINNSNTFVNNELKVVFVKPQSKEESKQIDVTPTEIQEPTTPINIKLVKSA